MKDWRAALRSVLLADSNVSTIVGGLRIYPSLLPQGQREPSVVYHRITESTGYHLPGGGSGLSQAIVQIDSWATTADAATQLGNAVFDAISGLRREASPPSGTIDFKGIFLVAGRDLFDEATQLFRLSRDYSIFYRDN